MRDLKIVIEQAGNTGQNREELSGICPVFPPLFIDDNNHEFNDREF